MMDPYMLGLNGFTNDPNWVMNTGLDYPRLSWEGTPGDIIPEPIIDWVQGHGTRQSPYRIDSADQVILLSKSSILWDSCFILGADIDLEPKLPGGQIFGQAIIPEFARVFNGNDHTISNLTISGGSLLGFFGRLVNGAEVKNLGVVDVSITGSGNYIGGLAGINRSNLSKCYSTGTISGSLNIGGLVGYNYEGNIITSYSNGTVSGINDVGGLVGENRNDGRIKNSYSTCAVSGDENIGGLVGLNRSGLLTNCYSAGIISGNLGVGGLVGEKEYWGVDIGCLWDMETSELLISAGGKGKTTAEMQTVGTFLYAGWDFVNETANGTEDIWWIDEGNDYPRLWWEAE
jgi:hypothetical protein